MKIKRKSQIKIEKIIWIHKNHYFWETLIQNKKVYSLPQSSKWCVYVYVCVLNKIPLSVKIRKTWTTEAGSNNQTSHKKTEWQTSHKATESKVMMIYNLPW